MALTDLSVVVKVQSDLVFTDDGKIDLDILHQMFELGLEALSGDSDSLGYLRSVFGSASTVGMKVNALGGPGASTHVELVSALSSLLADAGIPKKKHLIWDRSDGELSDLGYTIRSRGDGPYCFGTDHQGVGYSNDLVSGGQVGGLLSRILVDYCDALVNMPILKDHGVAGITGSLKNHYGSIHNPNKYHGNGCDPYIADLNSLEQIRSRQRLIVMDALKVQYQGGPAYQRRWAANNGALILSTDPVAVDSVGYRIIDELRRKAGLETIRGSKREPVYIETAARYGLGNSEPARIKVRELRV